MAKQPGLGDRLYVNGFDVSGDVGAIDRLDTPRAALDVTGINKSAHERILALADINLSFSAFYNDAAKRAHIAFRGLQTTARPALYTRGSTKGVAAMMIMGKQVNYDPTRNADGSFLFRVNINGSEGVNPEWGILLTNGLTTWSGSTETASRDDAAKSSAGMATMLQVTSKSSTGTLKVRVEHSSDNAVWAGLVTFTVVATGASRAAERKTVTGLVKRYLRVDTTGTFGKASLVVATRRGSTGEVITY